MRAVARLRPRTRRSGSCGKLVPAPLLRPLARTDRVLPVVGGTSGRGPGEDPDADGAGALGRLSAGGQPDPGCDGRGVAGGSGTSGHGACGEHGRGRLVAAAADRRGGARAGCAGAVVHVPARPRRAPRSRPGPARHRRLSTATPAPKPANGTTPADMKPVVRQRPAAPKPRSQKPVARPRRAETLLRSSAERPAAALPPDPRRGWRAEIEWTGAGDESRFAVVARTGKQADRSVVAQSAPLEWPPTSAAAVQALTDAVAELERELLAAGWVALEPGAGWYAKRFGWKPVIVVEPAPPAVERAAVRAAAPPAPAVEEPAVHAAAAPAAARVVGEREAARAGRFVRRPDWPSGSEQLWRCELRWEAGVVNSRFEAVAYEPGSTQHARPIGNSVTFKWLMMADPNPSADEYRTELRRLVTALQGAGWDYVGRGSKWYAARFVWRRAGAPPERLDAAALEAPQRSAAYARMNTGAPERHGAHQATQVGLARVHAPERGGGADRRRRLRAVDGDPVEPVPGRRQVGLVGRQRDRAAAVSRSRAAHRELVGDGEAAGRRRVIGCSDPDPNTLERTIAGRAPSACAPSGRSGARCRWRRPAPARRRSRQDGRSAARARSPEATARAAAAR